MNHYKSIRNIKIFSLVSFLVILSASCRLEVPVKEMALAKTNITRAVEVKSEKYAPQELQKARDELIKSHDNIKADDVKVAKKSAEESIKYSNEAIAKSLPLLADDNLKEARSIYDEADLAFAAKYAPEEFSIAGARIGESETLFSGKEYWESYLKSEEAKANAVNAKEKALSNIAALQDRINSIAVEAKNFESMGSREFAPDEMNTIDEALASAGSSLENKNVKDAWDNIAKADTALKDAGLKTWKAYAAARLKAAEDAIQKMEESPYKDSFTAELQKADSLVKESKDLYGEENYSDSNVKSEEALSLLNSIAIAIEQKVEAEKIEDRTAESSAVAEYVVKYNPKNRDCLWRIAMYVYKDARLWPLIYVANKDQIKDPDLIFPGQKLIVPAIPGAASGNETKSMKTDEQLSGKENVEPSGKDSKEDMQEEKIEENSVDIDTNETDTETPIDSNPAD